MNKEYKKIQIYAGEELENVVNKLLKFKSNNCLVKCEFNGITLYSDKVTMDNAYMQVTGKTKKEHDFYIKNKQLKLKEARGKHEEKIPELVSRWIEEGHKILSKDKWEKWDRIVPIRLKDLYEGMELKQCLDIAKMLEKEYDFAKIRKAVENQNHSGMSFSLICAMIKEFCKNGNEFVEYLKN